MNKTAKTIATLAATAVAALTFAACGSSSTPSASAATPAATEAPASTTTEAPVPAPAKKSSDPVALGTAVKLGDWSITIDSVVDVTGVEVDAEPGDAFNVYAATIRGTYLGDEAEKNVWSDFGIKTESADHRVLKSADHYVSNITNDGGRVVPEVSDTAVTTGGETSYVTFIAIPKDTTANGQLSLEYFWDFSNDTAQAFIAPAVV
jgi:hypothetical protein